MTLFHGLKVVKIGWPILATFGEGGSRGGHRIHLCPKGSSALGALWAGRGGVGSSHEMLFLWVGLGFWGGAPLTVPTGVVFHMGPCHVRP